METSWIVRVAPLLNNAAVRRADVLAGLLTEHHMQQALPLSQNGFAMYRLLTHAEWAPIWMDLPRQPSTVPFHWGCVQMCRRPQVMSVHAPGTQPAPVPPAAGVG